MSKFPGKIIPENTERLYIDIGNSRIKMAVLGEEGWQRARPFGHDEAEAAKKWASEQDGWSTIIGSSVVEKGEQLVRTIAGKADYHMVRVADIPGSMLDYDTPQTLGIDRFLACYGAGLATNRPVIVIDAGTACTVDLMTGDGVFHGGVIMPGLRLMEEGLQEHAPALPSVSRELPDRWPGKSTRESLQWGLTGAFRDAIDAAIKRYLVQWPMADIWLTGGDAELLQELISWDAKISETLVFEGLYRWIMERIINR